MDEKTRATIAALVERYSKLRREMAEALAECVFHKLKHGHYPSDMGARFRVLAERGQVIQSEMYDIRQRIERENKKNQGPFAGVQVPDHLPNEL